jgi:hypothetical protein
VAALVTKLRGESIENGDVINDFKGKPWRYRYTTRPGIDSAKLVVEPVKGGQSSQFFPSVFPGVTIEAA